MESKSAYEPLERLALKSASVCPLCGWTIFGVHGALEFDTWEGTISTLRVFDINSTEIALGELGSHLRRQFSDVYNLDWRRFEELIEDVFRLHGFEVILTEPTKDGGADLILLGAGGRVAGIVECKRFAVHRTVGISMVRTLVGAAVDWRVRDAYLVTSTEPTADAVIKAEEYRTRGYNVTLIGAGQLLEFLKVYNLALPSVDHLRSEDLQHLVEANRLYLREAEWFYRDQLTQGVRHLANREHAGDIESLP